MERALAEGVSMAQYEQNNSSKSVQTTRVISRKKQAKVTVGITISPSLLAEARKRNLSISRICEQAPSSIIEYVQPENNFENSISLNGCSLQRENLWAGSSVRHERRIRNAEVAGSNPARSTTGRSIKSYIDI